MKPLYEVGQIVKIVYSRHGHQFEIGEEVRVRTLLSDGYIDSCESLDGRDYWFVGDDEVIDAKGELQ